MSSILFPVLVTDALLGRSVRRMVALACMPYSHANALAPVATASNAAAAPTAGHLCTCLADP